ncbi:MAG: hypothetical protein QOC92_985 [Acidimicrobiaceae bacterium]
MLYGFDYGTRRTATVIAELGDNRFRIRLDPPDPRTQTGEADPRNLFILDLRADEIDVSGDELYVFRTAHHR